MGKYKYLFYDFDGTISNTYEGVAENGVGLSAKEGSWRMKKFSIDDYNKVYKKLQEGKLDIKDKDLPVLEYVDCKFIK